MVFINFRGRDQAGYAALLDRELTAEFGHDAVFLSSRSIVPGDDFAAEIIRTVRSCRVLLAVIGPDWLRFGTVGGSGDLSEVDWVHREITEAFVHGVRVVPILTEGAAMPAETELAKDIAALSRCQYLRLHHRNIDHDLARIVEVLARLLPAPVRTGIATSDVKLYQLAGPRPSPCRVGVIAGTIRRVRSADIWVNSENTDMEMARFTEFSVSAIVRYWGARRDEGGRVVADLIADELAERVGRRRPVAPCAAYVTGAGSLAETNNVRHIIHVAAVHGEPGAGFRQVSEIGWCVTQALAEAERLAEADPSVRSILFPLLGAGVGGAEVEPTATAMLEAVADHLAARSDTALKVIYLLAYTSLELRIVERVLAAMGRLAPVAFTRE